MRTDILLKDELINSVKNEVLPALGCTEPISLALACAIAASYLGEDITHIEAKVSPNLMKNGMGVTVPGTGMKGLTIAAAVGALGGDPEGGLEVLRKLTPDIVEQAKTMICDNKIRLSLAENDKLIYSEATVYSARNRVRVCIADTHTNVISIEKNETNLFRKNEEISDEEGNGFSFENVTLEAICDFVRSVPLSEICFIMEAEYLNDALSREGLSHDYGLNIGATLTRKIEKGYVSEDLLSSIIIRTSAASDARMGGAALPAMSNSGSGNQGIAATMPVVVVADHLNASEEERIRALFLAHLVAIFIHSKLPRLSAFCAVTTAAMGAAAGMAWLMEKQNTDVVSRAVNNMIGDITGVICDGASNSCAMKVSTAVSSAFKAVLLALDNIRVTGAEGIVANDVNQSIKNMGSLACHCMQQMDDEILKMMMEKEIRAT